MSSTSRAYQPDASESHVDDSESDLDLDLGELDPVTSSASVPHPAVQNSQWSREERHIDQERNGRIPLRNLRAGGLRGFGGRAAGRGGSARRGDGDDEDVHSLLNGEEEGSKRDSAGSFGAIDDDAPLLSSGNGQGRRQPKGEGSSMLKFSSRLRLPGFMSATSSLSTLPEDPRSEAEEEHDPTATRSIFVGQLQSARFPPNAVSNAKYTPWSFLPRTLYNEFSFFFNMYFLLVALSQIIKPLRIGYLSTYIVPLAFVLAITLGKEAIDDIGRRRRDSEANAEGYTVLLFDDTMPEMRSKSARRAASKTSKITKRSSGARRGPSSQTLNNSEGVDTYHPLQQPSANASEVIKKSRELKVGDVLRIGKDQRVPADVIILKSYTNESAVATVAGVSRPALSEHAADQYSNLVDPISVPPIELTTATEIDAKESVSPKNITPSTDAAGVGETFIRTDQLDGETDWKLRLPSPLTQSLDIGEFVRLRVNAGKPDKKINDFYGTVELLPNLSHQYDPHIDKGKKRKLGGASESLGDGLMEPAPATESSPLSIDNTAWANTVLASNSINLAVVVYTGRETRQAMSTSASRSKTGLLEYEINSLTKILCILTLALSFILVALEGFKSTENREWYVNIMRFLILFSTIIPISLRVNVDMGKSVYAWFIERDQGIPGAVVRTSTIPEELGRIEYLLSDKTGTLTQNEMELKKIHVGTVSYANEAMDEVASYVRQCFSVPSLSDVNQASALVTPSSVYITSSMATTATRTRREIGSRVRDVVLALALCHNVTPITEEEDGKSITTYQASSPDEIAIVRWTENVGLRLVHRDRQGMVLQSTDSGRVVVRVRILEVFPFTSEGKRMGIIVQFFQGSGSPVSTNEEGAEIWFYQKGADTVMTSIVAANDWLDEETENMAREGLRTLVVGRKKLSGHQYREFSSDYKQASLALQARDAGMAKVVRDYLERDLELLGVTGVEDKLQHDVKPSLELLRNAGIKIWMLTGDKVETARCVAVSAKLVARGQYVHTMAKLKRKDLAQDSLDFLQNKTDACLLIDGESLSLMLNHFRDSFISLAVLLPAVIACRCSPTQKADVAKLIRTYTRKRICCIGDGGNDVSMIQAADVGVGIVGKEGRQASLAADFSIVQFCHLTKLLVWHGRNSYKRSAKLAQFVIHRGLIISVCQTVFSIASKFEPVALYKDWLLVGYATVYTMMPVFSLVLDRDVDEGLANLYPELYKELRTGRSLSYQTFFIWVLVSIYQGGMIQGLSQILVGVHGTRMVSVSFTTLVINELVMVAFEITTWHPVMISSLIGTAMVYFGSIPFLGRYFDLGYVVTLEFVWKVVAISAISLIPPYAAKILRRTLKPPSYRKVQGL
ncbi:MAG: putative aminophospholipid-translocase [Pycnora praestabilis]|nr:MAG: putative aminophospholipid-translocase [Pycnora praestabilis]